MSSHVSTATSRLLLLLFLFVVHVQAAPFLHARFHSKTSHLAMSDHHKLQYRQAESKAVTQAERVPVLTRHPRFRSVGLELTGKTEELRSVSSRTVAGKRWVVWVA